MSWARVSFGTSVPAASTHPNSKAGSLLFRRLVVWVGKAALNEEEDFIALEILQSIEGLATLDEKELFYLGVAYSRDGLADENKERRHDRLQRARRLLERSIKQDPNDARAHFALARVSHHLGQYSLSIEHNDKAVSLGGTLLASYARWNKAITLLERGAGDGALDTLEEISTAQEISAKAEEISKGEEIWEGILRDEELEKLSREPGLRLRFEAIFYVKTN